jgi:diguanylate cyclase (GGDEF)-like protein
LSPDDPSPPAAYGALDHLPLGLIVADADLRVLFWNTCLEDWTGIERAEVLGSRLSERFPHFAEPRYVTRLATVLATGAPTVLSSQLHPHLVPCPLRGGRQRVLQTVAAAVPAADRGGYHLLLALQDVTSLSDALGALAAARDDLARQAATDPLTGIANRRHFVEEAGRIIANARRHGRPCALLEMDLDGLKRVNDTHGHAVGDELLLAFTRTCCAKLREGDVLGRLGGDEFAALLPETALGQAESIAERLRAAFREVELLAGGARVEPSVSVGVVAAGATGALSLEDLLREADRALYEAKRAGRNRVVVGSS